MQSTLKLRHFAAAAVLAVVASQTRAGQLEPLYYNMPNGQTGFWVYHDTTYDGIGKSFQDLAPLAGGSGKLTDGLFGTDYNWLTQELADPWVGWDRFSPTIDFNFGQKVHIDEIKLYTLRVTEASIFIPPTVTVASRASTKTLGAPITFNFDDASFPNDTPSTLTIAPNQTGSSFQLKMTTAAAPQFFDSWVFLTEVQFVGHVVPEPATWSLALCAAAALTVAARYRHRRKCRFGLQDEH